jgi:hypothetical protein
MQRRECVVVRQGRLVAVVRAFVIWCAFLLLIVGGSLEATASEEARCEGTRTIDINLPARFTTNDLPGCPKGGLLSGTDGSVDYLAGEKGDDEVRGLGGSDDVNGGPGSDILYGGPGEDAGYGQEGDDVIYAGPGHDGPLTGDDGDDVIYAGPGDDGGFAGRGGNDVIYGGPGDDRKLHGGEDGQRDELYCGEGRDSYYAEKIDYVSSSCEVKLGKSAVGPTPPPPCSKPFVGDVCMVTSPVPVPRTGGPAILLPATALLFGSGILTYAILRRR